MEDSATAGDSGEEVEATSSLYTSVRSDYGKKEKRTYVAARVDGLSASAFFVGLGDKLQYTSSNIMDIKLTMDESRILWYESPPTFRFHSS